MTGIYGILTSCTDAFLVIVGTYTSPMDPMGICMQQSAFGFDHQLMPAVN